jgi:hypothetical protein
MRLHAPEARSTLARPVEWRDIEALRIGEARARCFRGSRSADELACAAFADLEDRAARRIRSEDAPARATATSFSCCAAGTSMRRSKRPLSTSNATTALRASPRLPS